MKNADTILALMAVDTVYNRLNQPLGIMPDMYQSSAGMKKREGEGGGRGERERERERGREGERDATGRGKCV